MYSAEFIDLNLTQTIGDCSDLLQSCRAFYSNIKILQVVKFLAHIASAHNILQANYWFISSFPFKFAFESLLYPVLSECRKANMALFSLVDCRRQ